MAKNLRQTEVLRQKGAEATSERLAQWWRNIKQLTGMETRSTHPLTGLASTMPMM